jgi:hypothetical protein
VEENHVFKSTALDGDGLSASLFSRFILGEESTVTNLRGGWLVTTCAISLQNLKTVFFFWFIPKQVSFRCHTNYTK